MSRSTPALLIDLDGTLYTDAGALPGAVAAINSLRQSGIPFRFVTNTTRRSRNRLLERMRSYGFTAGREEIFSSVMAGVVLLRELSVRRVAPFVARDTLEDLADFDLGGGMTTTAGNHPEVVLVGDLGADWTPALLNEAFRYLLDGARLVALQKDRYWLGPTGLELDAGPYVTALEFATGAHAQVCGKPSPSFFQAALATLGLSLGAGARPAMVGDDLWADVSGAQQAGLQGWLVRTGKFREDVLASSGVRPDRLLGSVAELEL